MNCTNHTFASVSGICVSCRKPGCSDCLVEVSGKYHCRECLSNRSQRHDDNNNLYTNNITSEKGRSVIEKILWVLMTIYVPFIGIIVWEKGPFGSDGNKIYRKISWIWTFMMILSIFFIITEGV